MLKFSLRRRRKKGHAERDGDGGSVTGDDLEGHPSVAPEGSLWAKQDDVDFFINPALTLDTLVYISPNGDGPEGAFREAFDLPPKEEAQAEDAAGADRAPRRSS